MLDMGGVAQAKVDTSLEVGKNNKVQAIALDFELIIRAIDRQRKDEGILAGGSNNIMMDQIKTTTSSNLKGNDSILPDIGLVKNMAKLLNVQMGDNANEYETISRSSKDKDDLSLLTGSENDDDNNRKSQDKVKDFDPSALDIRSKYASKLRSKVEGGLAGVELANSKKEESLTRGDAAGHLFARSIAASNTVSKSGSKWMASTGTGSLCSFLSNRSMKIALIPLPTMSTSQDRIKTKEGMEQLANQLPQVKFSVLGLDDDVEMNNAKDILSHITKKMNVPTISTIVVSDRDDYLGSARDLGMFSCRVRRLNAPRGNISTSYTVEDIKDVKDVVNELNGISYNTAVFNQ